MAKKGTKAYQQEYISVVYGINKRLKKVRSVWVQRNGVLSGTAENGMPVQHPIKPGWTAEREAALIFGLQDTFSVPIGLDGGEYTKKRIKELEEKAASLPDNEPTPPSS